MSSADAPNPESKPEPGVAASTTCSLLAMKRQCGGNAIRPGWGRGGNCVSELELRCAGGLGGPSTVSAISAKSLCDFPVDVGTASPFTNTSNDIGALRSCPILGYGIELTWLYPRPDSERNGSIRSQRQYWEEKMLFSRSIHNCIDLRISGMQTIDRQQPLLRMLSSALLSRRRPTHTPVNLGNTPNNRTDPNFPSISPAFA